MLTLNIICYHWFQDINKQSHPLALNKSIKKQNRLEKN